jgi:uncharacterized protein (UPF0297 family)/DNA-binding MarR family transcriptional regulator
MTIQSQEDVLVKKFPPAVAAAQTRFAMHVSNWALNIKVIRLAQIFISHSPRSALDRPVTCSRQKAADLLQVSVRTVTRYCVELERRGIIDRLPQEFNAGGKPECMRIRWTEAGKTLFALSTAVPHTRRYSSSSRQCKSASAIPELAKSQIVNEPANVPYLAKAADQKKAGQQDSTKHLTSGTAQVLRGPNLAHITNPSCNQEVSIENKPLCATPKENHSNATRLPSDIVEFADALHLRRPQICYLFMRCKEKGQRLQDVLHVSLNSMIAKGLTGRDAVSWIIGLLKSGRDFSAAVKQHQKKKRKAEDDVERQRAVRNVIDYLSNNPVRLPSGNWLVEVRYSLAFFAKVQDGASFGSQPIHHLASYLVSKEPAWLARYMGGEKSCAAHARSIETEAPAIAEVSAESVAEATVRKGLALLRTSNRTGKAERANLQHSAASTVRPMSTRAAKLPGQGW